ncbi:TIGR04086 family membrane protein [Halalkalibacterium halodurans]|uniref:BH1230 protein n=2 Tax=Halalkalibacterium halodurans TaxID=86665 RepID=Q9KDI3_HALH5|nr:TIGR04086 family membrane protein [Halalkalibacterium halodurans]MDY7221753.1 TIGR04086 family membrane protein [Halalkalibacterium halodurans]MDY7241029.1 TIGR04086 family membrane protein [Halalkalibacterium halodurans]MED3645558.1 TIGR04086 family membrane protein [Halalkalibacterium halodurans]MED4079427.1 TIGR04086 family membrane protein [Halalkalibacterium halodurans]MED4086551.1 TIGR04086 family membrane protein [Halalkalibacterium halodurans]
MSLKNWGPALLMGLLTIMIVVLSFSLLASLIVHFSSLTEMSFQWAILAIAFIALFLGGAVAGAKTKERGWMIGALTALFFSLVTFLIMFLGYNTTFTTSQMLIHGGYLLAGMLGGIIGVNFSGGKDR